jgi:PST family polysaccharide transporter
MEENKPQAGKSSYGQILESSSVIGGSNGINYVISLARIKIVAILLGPSGIGLIGLYQSTIGLVGTLSGMGIGSSGVREVASAHGTGSTARMATAAKTLRRLSMATGVLGCLLTIALASPLSRWTFGTEDYAFHMALLGVTVLLAAIHSGQAALLQGTRRIKELAAITVISAAVSTTIAIAVYAVFGVEGIVPVLIATAAINLMLSWWAARRIAVPEIALRWSETWQNGKALLELGLAFMWGALLAAAVALILRSVIVRELGLGAAGIYTSAWGLSGMFASFVLGAMGTDFYPRLTAAAHDDAEVNRLVNEQIEIGVLLALPGLVATQAFAPLVMRLFYSSEFLAGAELLQWFVLGVMLQVVAWPLGFIQRAKGASLWMYLSQTEAWLVLLGLSIGLLHYYDDVVGVAIALPCMYAAHLVITVLIARHLSSFRYTPASIRLQQSAVGLTLIGFSVQRWLPHHYSLAIGALLTIGAVWFSLRGIVQRIGDEHSVARFIRSLPGGKFI